LGGELKCARAGQRRKMYGGGEKKGFLSLGWAALGGEEGDGYVGAGKMGPDGPHR